MGGETSILAESPPFPTGEILIDQCKCERIRSTLCIASLPQKQGSLRPALDFAAMGLDRRGGKVVAITMVAMIDPNATFQTHTSLETRTHVQTHTILETT